MALLAIFLPLLLLTIGHAVRIRSGARGEIHALFRFDGLAEADSFALSPDAFDIGCWNIYGSLVTGTDDGRDLRCAVVTAHVLGAFHLPGVFPVMNYEEMALCRGSRSTLIHFPSRRISGDLLPIRPLTRLTMPSFIQTAPAPRCNFRPAKDLVT